MNWKRILPLFFATLLFVGVSTTALADGYRGRGASPYSHRIGPHYNHHGHGHDFRWYKHGGDGYHNGRKYQGKHYHDGPFYSDRHSYPHRWQGGPFFGGSFFLPGWGVMFGHGRW